MTKTNKITIITDPDVLFSETYSILLMCLRSEYLNNALEELGSIDIPINVYVYDGNGSHDSIKWALTVFDRCNVVIIDVDNADPITRKILGYFIPKPKTFWLTNEQNSIYNILSVNKIYNFEFLSNIGGSLERK